VKACPRWCRIHSKECKGDSVELPSDRRIDLFVGREIEGPFCDCLGRYRHRAKGNDHRHHGEDRGVEIVSTKSKTDGRSPAVRPGWNYWGRDLNRSSSEGTGHMAFLAKE